MMTSMAILLACIVGIGKSRLETMREVRNAIIVENAYLTYAGNVLEWYSSGMNGAPPPASRPVPVSKPMDAWGIFVSQARMSPELFLIAVMMAAITLTVGYKFFASHVTRSALVHEHGATWAIYAFVGAALLAACSMVT